MQDLFETYDRCRSSALPDAKDLSPIAHTTQQAHIEIVVDGEGCFRRANVVVKDDQETLIPCTEQSSGRAGVTPVPHPLCDKLQYIAGDFHAFGGTVTRGFAKTPETPHADYLAGLTAWSTAAPEQGKLQAVLAYVRRGHVVQDLVREGVLPVANDDQGIPKLLDEWNESQGDTPAIFRLMPGEQTPEDSFIRWRVETGDVLATGTWEDDGLVRSWQTFFATQQVTRGLCMVTGQEATLADQHPKKLRNSGDRAKLISSNDSSGFTFRGRFTDASQAASVSFEVTQKAHSALRWLIGRQKAFRGGDQVFVSWAVSGQVIPDLWANSMEVLGDTHADDAETETQPTTSGDVGEDFSRRLNLAIAGYRANLADTDHIVVMGLDSATPGRMAVTYYRKLKGSEFLQRLQAWHESTSWPQNLGKNLRFVGAPAARDIAEAAYGQRLDDRLKKATVERLIPCIVDGQQLPTDLVRFCVRRAFNRVGLEPWEWEKCLGIACALFRGFHTERGYRMALEVDRKTRDYLFGRLLAVAEHLEDRALYVGGETTRSTTAARLMQRFADRPYSTWRTIELALAPYKSRLRSSRAGFLWQMDKLLDEVLGSFVTDNPKEAFTSDRPLSGEFLLSFHCQRQALHTAPGDRATDADANTDLPSSTLESQES